jgi:hypothetical protein
MLAWVYCALGALKAGFQGAKYLFDERINIIIGLGPLLSQLNMRMSDKTPYENTLPTIFQQPAIYPSVAVDAIGTIYPWWPLISESHRSKTSE